MQDQYAGDIGDYVKLAILRAIAPGRALWIAWWLYPDEDHNGDGRHIGYLDHPDEWRACDPTAFDHLKAVVTSGERCVAALEHPAVLPGARLFREPVPTGGTASERRLARTAWFARLTEALGDRDLLFLDPDNGLETKSFDIGGSRAGKSVALTELAALQRPGRAILVYHHQTRMRGGHDRELEHWGERLRATGFHQVDALRASAYSARAFFLLDAPPEMRARAEPVTAAWRGRLSWRPDLGLGASTEEQTDVSACVASATRLLMAAAREVDLQRRGKLMDEAMRWHALAVRADRLA